MKSLGKKSLIYKFFIFILPFIALSIIITSLFLSFASYGFFQKTINQDYRNIIKSSAGEIRVFMESAGKNLESLAVLMAATKPDKWQKEIALSAFLHTNGQFVSVGLFSPRGKPIVPVEGDDPASDETRAAIIAGAVSGRKTVSGVMLGKENMPVVHIGIPVLRLGKTDEVLIATLNLKSVWDVLEGITIGKSGQVYIMDLSGRYIAHKDIDRVVRTPPAAKPDILAELRQGGTTAEWMENVNGVRSYNLGVNIPGLDWIIVLTQPSREIFEYLYNNFIWAFLITLALCFIATLLGWRWVKRLLLPVQLLHRQVRIIGRGNLEQKVSIESEDEIGDLGRAFNEMTISLKKYIEREIETARKLVHAENLAVLGTTYSKVTHELGNFLNNIHMALSGLGRETLGPTGVKILSILEREAKRMTGFVENIMQFARRPEPNLRKMAIDIIIREVTDLYTEEAGKKRVQIEIDWPEQSAIVNIDTGLMHQVFHNLVKNCLDAVTEGGIIRIRGTIDSDSLIIIVEDTGCGMDEQIQNQIFEPFFTTKGSDGTGLGMSIVKNIIEAHHGTIDCQSRPDEGTTFIIRLPLADGM
ncbi:MAG: sensor histidine kinase [Deltaproteobacteria bacterium]|nr:sensor histidine kinase [Deltaproteobacteria bacterium]